MLDATYTKNIAIILAVTLFILQILDVHSTARALRLNLGEEKNPIVLFFMQKIGVLAALLLLKAAVVLVALFLFYTAYSTNPQTVDFVLAGLNIFYAYVVYNNYSR